MTLQQLKYICASSKYKTMREASKNLYISQPAISSIIKNLEDELKITIFEKSGKGITITQDGQKLIHYATRMIECENEIRSEFHCENTDSTEFVFSVSSQHYMFNMYAFSKTLKHIDADQYEVRLRETSTINLLGDVASRKSELGFFTMDRTSKRQISQLMKTMGLEFHVIHTGKPYVFLSCSHPLAMRSSLTLEDLEPYPCIQYDQGDDPLHFFFEEPVITGFKPRKVIVASDQFAGYTAWKELDAYNIGTGVLSPEIGDHIVVLPLEEDVWYDLGYVTIQNALLSEAALYLVETIKSYLPKSELANS